ncbi:hypothetical protein U6G28_08575 [Actinomycetaceae bacterium MB13-C1-2]|nr:hypothetical protein U6G28_08575 [Actinomycetaceae bacterium MB13-C1-2]
MRLPRVFRFGDKNSQKEISSPQEELSLDQLVPDRVPIAECPERFEVVVAGLVSAVEHVTMDNNCKFIAVLDDDSGSTLRLVWLGRGAIPGLSPGRPLKARGTVQKKTEGLTMMDPSYTILNRRGS